MSNVDSMQLAWVAESTYGTTPASNMDIFRFTAESLSQNTGTATSAEINSTRQVSDVIRTNVDAQGEVSIELSYGSFDELLEGALYSAGWSSAVALLSAASLTITGATGVLNGTGIGSSAVAGQWIKVTGASTNASPFYAKIVSVTDADNIVVSAGALLSDETFTATVSMGAQIVNGTTQSSYTLEKDYTDLSNILAIITGAVVSSFSLDVPTAGIVTGGFGFTGQSEASASSSPGSGYNSVSTTEVMNSIDNINSIAEGDHAAATSQEFQATALSFALDNNLRARQAVANLGAISIGEGKVAVTGTLQAYFQTVALIDKYLNFTASAISMTLTDSAGNAYVIDIPRVKYTNGTRVGGGENQDVIADMEFTAYKHPTEGVTIRIVRFPA